MKRGSVFAVGDITVVDEDELNGGWICDGELFLIWDRRMTKKKRKQRSLTSRSRRSTMTMKTRMRCDT